VIVPALVALMMGLALPRDRVNEICVIGGDIVYCAPERPTVS
jgi:hypothetical protein